MPLYGPDGKTLAGYIGVEVPLADFVPDARSDEFTLGLISIFAILGTALLVFFFVERFVRRPVNRLERGVARIAGGDYSTDIPVTSSDELGRLAGGVNRMRAEIAQYVTQIEQARARLDGAVEELGGVSRALDHHHPGHRRPPGGGRGCRGGDRRAGLGGVPPAP